MKPFIALTLVSTVLAQSPQASICNSPPAKGYGGLSGGIFGIAMGSLSIPKEGAPKGATPAIAVAPKSWDFLCKRINGSTFPTGPEYPAVGIKRVNREGTGPYKSAPYGRVDATLPGHTI